MQNQPHLLESQELVQSWPTGPDEFDTSALEIVFRPLFKLTGLLYYQNLKGKNVSEFKDDLSTLCELGIWEH